MARDTKLGPEEITRDIPIVRKKALKNTFDEAASSTSRRQSAAGDIYGRKIKTRGKAR